MLDEGLDHEYAPISGFPAFTNGSAALAFGDDSPVVKDGLVRKALSCIFILTSI
jgi:aspartate/tyrosine/aromatic aminotransferase